MIAVSDICPTTLRGAVMHEQAYKSVVVVVLPGDNIVTYVVHQSETGTQIEAHADESIPPAAAPLLLLQLCSAVLPAGHVGFHVWKALNALTHQFSAVNDQMANVPAVSEDELPF